MLDEQIFVELLINALRIKGYSCVNTGNEVKVTKNGSPVTDVLGRGEFRIYRNAVCDMEYNCIRSIYNSLHEAYTLYEKGEAMEIDRLYHYHKLCEFDKHILAARLMGCGFLEFVTWQQNADKTRVDIGHYFKGYENAKEDFALRCGLIDRNKLFNETEMKLIRQGLIHLGADFPELTYEQNTLLGKVVERIEMIVPEIRGHEELEHHELVPDDGLEV